MAGYCAIEAGPSLEIGIMPRIAFLADRQVPGHSPRAGLRKSRVELREWSWDKMPVLL